jgi:thiol:disulfide interchange protein
MPQSKTFNIISGKEVAPDSIVEQELSNKGAVTDKNGWHAIADRFEITGSASGYHGPEEFISFLNDVDFAGTGSESSDAGTLGEHGLWLTILLILLGGMALNLTPCVLPMIPINIAIIGAGVQSGSRGRGFLLGAVYGLGIALVYGVLGLVVVLTGAKFGSLNSHPAFNFAIAVLFAVLALSMFGLFNIDFSRLQNKFGGASDKRGGLLPAFMMGGVAALLAGACVAPVVISVLLLATNLYQSGHISALLLPFVLGLGMALPWPFAGGGLSFLPKPGEWMERITQGFGVIIMIAALYYGFVGYRLIKNRNHETDFTAMLQEAEKDGRPVLIDFWATWCKNCAKMEKSTFHDPKVLYNMDKFFLIKYQAEDMSAPETKAVLDYYKVMGLPTYIKLTPKK